MDAAALLELVMGPEPRARAWQASPWPRAANMTHATEAQRSRSRLLGLLRVLIDERVADGHGAGDSPAWWS